MWMKVFVITFLVLQTFVIAEREHPRRPISPDYKPYKEELSSEYWNKKAENILKDKLKLTSKESKRKAKNVILFLGDGMSIHTVTATRNFLGDSSQQVYFETFPYIGLSKTYSIDKRVPDSASTATAYLTGVKGNYGTIGVTAQVQRRNCFQANDTSTHTESIAKWAQDAEKWTGLVTTARVTHASPAGLYAHTANRDWENDAAVRANGCNNEVNTDIARQLLEWPVGRKMRVILGGGRRNFLNETKFDESGEPGRRTDGRDLALEWLENKRRRKYNAHYVWSKSNLTDASKNSKTDYLLGLFSSSHCPYHGDLKRNNLEERIPSLTEMTEVAIKLLRRNKKGFFLFVEGAKIDMAHHDTRAQKSLEDTAEFARAVQLARNMTSISDTLIVVTSDHSHTMTINGFPYRKQNIFGLAPNNAADGLPYTILSYANGPGYSKTYSSKTGRRNLRYADFTDPKYKYMATVPLSSETHGGDDVGVFASGPYEHYFTGNYEQTQIPALMAHAANIGPFAKRKI
ncbi:membrane-bound alkaline phosphatase [Teleopsis dalmanni]|uniref:membrane-bound alkaline phosphatase n=1 Tax=Teleopsis dalmanni TaxID=139649 RepID=UPI0018CDDFDD|nr:membrane-bound alkaline phosphatase [Teleopsis dalmanni]